MNRDCLERGPACTGSAIPGKARCRTCERARQRVRNAKPERRALYGGTWPAESLAIRAAQPWCSTQGCTGTRLSVDHPTRSVFCLECHGALEAARRAAQRAGVMA